MKKVFSFILSIVILLSSMSFTVSSHYCAGKKVKTSLSIGNAAISCGMRQSTSPADTKTKIKSNCCQNHFSAYGIADDFSAQNVPFDFPSNWLSTIPNRLIAFVGNKASNLVVFHYHSPPTLIRDIPVLIQTFRI